MIKNIYKRGSAESFLACQGLCCEAFEFWYIILLLCYFDWESIIFIYFSVPCLVSSASLFCVWVNRYHIFEFSSCPGWLFDLVHLEIYLFNVVKGTWCYIAPYLFAYVFIYFNVAYICQRSFYVCLWDWCQRNCISGYNKIKCFCFLSGIHPFMYLL